MLLLRTDKLPEGGNVMYVLNFDGFRALAIKTARKVVSDRGMTKISTPGTPMVENLTRRRQPTWSFELWVELILAAP